VLAFEHTPIEEERERKREEGRDKRDGRRRENAANILILWYAVFEWCFCIVMIV